MSTQFKSFTFSFFLHTAVITGYIFYFYKPIELKSEEIESVTINLIEKTPKVVKQKEEMLVQKKKIEKPKVVKQKSKPKPKTRIEKVVEKKLVKPKSEEKPKLIKKQEPVKEQVIQKKLVKEFVKKEKKVEKQVISKASPKKTTRDFVKTNFEIIRGKVLSYIVYPRMARKMKHTGVVHLALVIGTDGQIIDIKIEKSSGKRTLDKAALKAANKLKEEMLPKPQRISTVVLPISFKLNS